MRSPNTVQRGLSLVELMVGMSVGLVISLGLFMLVSNTSRAFRVQDDFARLQENGTMALRYIVDDLRMAGFYGLAQSTQSATTGTAALADMGISGISSDCGAALADGTPWALNVAQPVLVISKTAGGAVLTKTNINSTVPCIQANDFDEGNASVIVLRGALGFQVRDLNGDGNLVPELEAQPNYATTLYVQSSPNADPNTLVFRGDVFSPKKSSGIVRSLSTGADAPIFEYQSHVYYVRPCSRPTPPLTTCSPSLNDDGGTSIPTLVRHEMVGAAMQLVPLVEGIERVSLLYGLYADNDGVAEQFTATPADTAWEQVIAVQVSVLARTPNSTPGYSDVNKTYDLGGGVNFTCTPAVNCNFKRHVFTQIASIRNCAQRRGMGKGC